MESNEVPQKPQDTVAASPTPPANPTQSTKKEPGLINAIALIFGIILIAIIASVVLFIFGFQMDG